VRYPLLFQCRPKLPSFFHGAAQVGVGQVRDPGPARSRELGPFLARVGRMRVDAQAAIPAGDVKRAPSSATSVRTLAAQAAQGSIVVDGRLDEAAWLAAPVASGFTQSEPRTGEPASESTEVRVLPDAA